MKKKPLRNKIDKNLKDNELSDALIKTIPFGMDIVDENGRILYMNERLVSLVGKKAIGKKCFQVYRKDKIQCADCPLKNSLYLGETQTIEIDGFLDNRSFKITHTGIIHKGKKAVLEIFNDITSAKKAEKKLKTLNIRLKRANNNLKHLALKDSHTKLYNYYYLSEIIEHEFKRAQRQNSPLSVIMIDIDYFKAINDVYGHVFGNLVLKQLASKMKDLLREYDIIFRYGGDEFTIVSPGTDRSAALDLAKRLLHMVKTSNFGNKKQKAKLKLSLAVSSYPEDDPKTGMGLISLADTILKTVKEYGGNKAYSSDNIKQLHEKNARNTSKNTQLETLKSKLHRLIDRANQSVLEEIFSFAKTINQKHKYFSKHAEGVARLATDMSRELKLPEEMIIHIGQAAILKDLGKVGINEKIIHKKTKWTQQEYDEFKKHIHAGVEIVSVIPFLRGLVPLLLHYCERWDGVGYPDGLKGNDIPIGARILRVADTYQALISNRPYRKAYQKKEAIKIIQESSGIQFDPKVIEALLKILRKK